MAAPRWLRELNIIEQAKKYGIPLWQHPQFLFLVMGLIIIGTMLFVYVVGLRFISDPLLIALIIIGVTGILLVMAFVITRSFERLAEANRLKAEFVGIVSHQLRSPLSNLAWAVEFLQGERAGKVREEQKEYLAILQENAKRMQELVNDLLQTSRIDQGELPFSPERFSLPEFVRELVEEFRPRVQEKDIALTVDGEEEVSEVHSDPQLLREVVANLLDNAVRYAWRKEEGEPERDRKIRIRYLQKGGKLYFEVEDNGIGIPKEDQKFIFQRFFRASKVRQHDTHGSGLGLYIAKSIIESAGGTMGFESREHKGSTFWFTIPVT